MLLTKQTELISSGEISFNYLGQLTTGEANSLILNAATEDIGFSHAPENQRHYLLDIIVMSLDRPDSQIDNIWLDEAQKRFEAFRAGKTKGIPARDVVGSL